MLIVVFSLAQDPALGAAVLASTRGARPFNNSFTPTTSSKEKEFKFPNIVLLAMLACVEAEFETEAGQSDAARGETGCGPACGQGGGHASIHVLQSLGDPIIYGFLPEVATGPEPHTVELFWSPTVYPEANIEGCLTVLTPFFCLASICCVLGG